MHNRILYCLLKITFFLCAISPSQFAASATISTNVVVKVTVFTPPPGGTGDLMFSSSQIDLRGKVSDEITVYNNSDVSREIGFKLTPPSVSTTECQIYYSPTSALMPPRGKQVVRLLIKKNNSEICSLEHQLTISDLRTPQTPVFNVPVYTDQF